MFPLRDLSASRGSAIVTIALIVLSVVSFFAWQPHGDPEAEAAFLYGRAAVACEVMTLTPVSRRDLAAGRCRPERAPDSVSESAPLFPVKQIALSVLVSMFLHGGLVHLLGNMWFLWIFGDNVEETFGHLGYLLLYGVAGAGATLGFSMLHPDNVEPLIGASGAIAGVLGAYLVLFPRGWVLALGFLGILPVPSVIFLGLWFAGQFGVAAPGVAWEAHVAGFMIGAVVSLLFRRRLLGRARSPSRRSPGAWRRA